MKEDTKYIYSHKYNKSSFFIIKENTASKYFGTFKNKSNAMKIRDLLQLFKWNVTFHSKKYEKHNYPKYIYKNTSNNFFVRKIINNKQYNFGSFKTLEEALEHIEFLEKENWDTKYSKHYKKELPKYIHQEYNDKYVINKHINGKNTHFGTFNTLEEALRERDLLIKYDWDYDLLVECEDTN